MMTQDRLTKKGAAWLADTGPHNSYLKEISWNMRTMMGQADVLETIILEIKNDIDKVRRGVVQK